MSETCNHTAAAMFRVEAAVRTGLTNPSFTKSTNECQPCRKVNKLAKIKDLSFDSVNFAERRKEIFNPLAESDKKPLSLIDFTSAHEEIT